MDDAATRAPLPLLFADADASYIDTAVAAAIARAAHALDWALRGEPAHRITRWMHVTRAAVLRAPDVEAALGAEGHSRAVARKLTRRIAPLAARARLRPGTPDDRWVGIGCADGVPSHERPVLLALAHLAVEAARGLAVGEESEALHVHTVLTPVHDAPPRSGEPRRWAGLLATRLDGAGLLERERLDVLALTAHALIDRHGALADWLPRESDPTVRVRDPAEHPGVPFAFVPFVATHNDALDALSDGALLDEAAAHAARGVSAHPAPQPALSGGLANDDQRLLESSDFYSSSECCAGTCHSLPPAPTGRTGKASQWGTSRDETSRFADDDRSGGVCGSEPPHTRAISGDRPRTPLPQGRATGALPQIRSGCVAREQGPALDVGPRAAGLRATGRQTSGRRDGAR